VHPSDDLEISQVMQDPDLPVDRLPGYLQPSGKRRLRWITVSAPVCIGTKGNEYLQSGRMQRGIFKSSDRDDREFGGQGELLLSDDSFLVTTTWAVTSRCTLKGLALCNNWSFNDRKYFLSLL